MELSLKTLHKVGQRVSPMRGRVKLEMAGHFQSLNKVKLMQNVVAPMHTS